MGERLVVVQHHPAEGAGELGVWARGNGVELDTFRADEDALPPVSDAPCVLLGGPCSVNDPPAWLRREKLWLREVLAAEAPVLGICLGSQLLAEALGGRVEPMAVAEAGWTWIAFAAGAKLEVLQWHEEAFTPPPGCVPLASSASCASQMFRMGHRIGIQFHPEWNADLVAGLNVHFGAESPLPTQVEKARHALVSAWFHRLLDDWRGGWRASPEG